jgi:hypothetical protein
MVVRVLRAFGFAGLDFFPGVRLVLFGDEHTLEICAETATNRECVEALDKLG